MDEPKNIMQSVVRQMKKDRYSMISLFEVSRIHREQKVDWRWGMGSYLKNKHGGGTNGNIELTLVHGKILVKSCQLWSRKYFLN